MSDEVEQLFENIRRDLRAINDKISQFKQDVSTNQDNNNQNNSTIIQSQDNSTIKREDNEKFGVVEDRQISVS